MEEGRHFSPVYCARLSGAVEPAQRWQSLTCALAQLKIRLQMRWCFFTAQNSENVPVWKSTFLASCRKLLTGCPAARVEQRKNEMNKNRSGFESGNFSNWAAFFFITFGLPCWALQSVSPVKWLEMKWHYGSLSLEIGGKHLSVS